MPLAPRPRHLWQLPRGPIPLGDRTLLMGILNLTPDSFSDGGRLPTTQQALTRALTLLDQGADILDLGAESTRPNATPLSPAHEQARLLPTLHALRRARPDALLSVDTYHAATAQAALQTGADIINDVSGLSWDPHLLPALTAAAPPPGLVLMHTRATPPEWSTLPSLEPAAVISLVHQGLATILARATTANLSPDTIVLDPGFGFGKRGPENLPLLRHLASLHSLGRPLLVGLSRKRFLTENPAHQTEETPKDDAASEARLHATLAANTAAILAGAHILRVHDLPAARAAASLADRLLPL